MKTETKVVIIIIILVSLALLLLSIFLPFLIKNVKSSSLSSSFWVCIDFQVGNKMAILNLPPQLTEFKGEREIVQVALSEAPFIAKTGTVMLAVRDLEILFPGKIEWNLNHTIQVQIPAGIISKGELLFTLTTKDFIIQKGRAFISIRTLSKLLHANEIIWIPETQGVRIIWYNTF